MKLTILGLGEASSLIAKGLSEQGIDVVAYDPVKPKNPVVLLVDSLQDSVAEADVVFSLSSSTASLKLAEQLADSLKPGALYCDLNASTPSLKKRLAEILPPASFVDVAVMGSVGSLAEKTPLSISGSGAKKFMELFDGFDLNLTYVSEIAGEAAARKMISTLLHRGIASVVIDTLWAAKEIGLDAWALEEIKKEFDGASSETAQALLNSTGKLAKPRSVQLGDVVEMLSDANYESTTLNGTAATLSKVMHGKKIPFANTSD